MGICSNKNFQKTQSSAKLITTVRLFQGVEFFLSTDNLKTINSDALVLFVDKSCSVYSNAVLKKAGKHQVRLVQEHFDTQIGRRKLSFGQCFMFKNPDIDGLDYEYLMFVCLEVWDRRIHTRGYLQDIFIKILSQLHEKDIRSVCLVEIDAQLGYPPNCSANAFVRAFHEQKNEIKRVTIMFHDVDNRSIFTSAIRAYEDDQMTTINQNDSVDQSVYF